MKINEVLQVRETAVDDQDALKQILGQYGKQESWKEIQKDPNKLDDERIVDGIKYKGYVDTKLNTFFVYDEAERKFVVADPSFTRRFFGKNLGSRMANLFNFGPEDKSVMDKFRDMFDFNDPSYAGAGERIKYANTKGMRGRLARTGATLGGALSKGGRGLANLVKKDNNTPQQVQIKDAWESVYGIKAPAPGSTIVFKTTDGKTLSGKLVKLTNDDRDGDGVPDLQIKGYFDPLRPKIPTLTGIASSRVLTINGQQLTRQTPQNNLPDPGAI